MIELISGSSVPSVSGGESISAAAAAGVVESAIIREFSLFAEVSHVIVDESPECMEVWIATDDHEHAIREAIFSKELELLDAFPECSFDFNLVPALGRSPEEIVSHGRVLYSR